MNQPVNATTPINSGTIGLKDAAAAFGVSTDTLRRRIKDGKMHEACLVSGKYGDTYELPMGDLVAIADREDWMLDLTAVDAHIRAPRQNDGLLVPQELIDRLVSAEAAAETSTVQREQAERERDRARSDLEVERVERQRMETDLNEAMQAKTIAEARTDEVRLRVEEARAALNKAETQAVEAEGKRAELSSELIAMGERSSQLESELKEALSEARNAQDAMGWWSRKRYTRRHKQGHDGTN